MAVQGILGAIAARLQTRLSNASTVMNHNHFNRWLFTIQNAVIRVPRHERARQFLQADIRTVHVSNRPVGERVLVLVDTRDLQLASAALAKHGAGQGSGADSHAPPLTGRAAWPMLQGDLYTTVLLPEPLERRQGATNKYARSHLT